MYPNIYICIHKYILINAPMSSFSNISTVYLKMCDQYYLHKLLCILKVGMVDPVNPLLCSWTS